MNNGVEIFVFFFTIWGQLDSFRQCVTNHGSNHTYLAFFDVDEFLVFYEHGGVSDLFDKYMMPDEGEAKVRDAGTELGHLRDDESYDDFGVAAAKMVPVSHDAQDRSRYQIGREGRSPRGRVKNLHQVHCRENGPPQKRSGSRRPAVPLPDAFEKGVALQIVRPGRRQAEAEAVRRRAAGGHRL